MTLYPFQEQAVRYISNRTHTLLADEQGLGKTIQAIGVINDAREWDSKAKILIVTPAGLKNTWRHELEKWLSIKASIYIQNKTTDIFPEADILIVGYPASSYAGLRQQLLMRTFDLAVFDEVQMLGTAGSVRTCFFLGYMRKKYRRTLALSGTPLRNRPMELYALLKSCAPDVIAPITTKHDFGMRYCGGYFSSIQNMWRYVGATNVDELNRKLRESGYMVRRTKDEVLKDLPPRQYQMVLFDSSTCSKEIQDRTAAIDHLEAQKKLEAGRNLNIMEFAPMRQELLAFKLPEVIKHIDHMLLTYEKVVVFCYHLYGIHVLMDQLKHYKPMKIVGSQLGKVKDNAVKTFQTNQKCRVIICQIQAGSVGFTLTASNLVIFVEISWSPSDVLQAIDRVHRIGQDKPVLAQFLTIEKTLEEYIMASMIKKLKNITGVLK